MFRPKNLFGSGWDCKDDFIQNLELADIHDLVVRMKWSDSNVVYEGDVVLWMPVLTEPVLLERDALNHVVDGCDDLERVDEIYGDEQKITSTADCEAKLPEIKSFWTSTTINAD